jgi:HK97 family phage major capsid protein
VIPVNVAQDVIKIATEQSAALTLFRRAQLSTKQTKLPVLSALPVAYWVSGDTGLKQTSEANWAGLTLEAEEIATIVPIPEAVLNDAGFDIWSELRDSMAEAIAVVLDAAVFGGINKPASWPQGVVPAAIAAGNQVELGTATAAQGGVVGDLESTFDQVEADGYTVNGVAAVPAMRGLPRKARNTQGEKLADISDGTIDGVPISWLLPGTVPATTRAISGDYSMGVIGVRQDLTYKLLDQAVLTDAGGLVVYNLPQQDLVALRLTARFAFQVAIPATRTGAATPYPFSVLQDVTP